VGKQQTARLNVLLGAVVILVIGFGLSLVIPSTVYGADNGYFESDYGRVLSHEPTICLFQPDDIRIDEKKWKNYVKEMKIGVYSWNSALNVFHDGDWTLNVVEVPRDKLSRLNHSQCDIPVTFTRDTHSGTPNALGWASPTYGYIELKYHRYEFCGTEYNSEFKITINTICFSNELERPKYVASVLQHEIGHTLGLGHYIGYDYTTTQQWYDYGIGMPSIMTYQTSNEELKTITKVDVNKIYEIYGKKGFGKKTDLTPIFNEPIIVKPTINLSGRGHLEVSEGQSSSYTISGDVPDKLFKRGEHVKIVIERPDGTTEYEATTVSKTLKKFNKKLVFNYSDPPGKYKISIMFNGEIFDKKEVQLSKDSSKNSSSNVSKSQKDTSFVVKQVKLVKIKLNAIKTNEPIIAYVTDSKHYWADKRPNFVLSKQTTHGWNEVITVNGKLGNDWYEGSFGNASYYSDGKYKMQYSYGNTQTKVLYQGTAFFEIKNNSESNKFKEQFIDSDGDGIYDDVDKCPETHGLGNDDGCRSYTIQRQDSDGDGFIDSKDDCPTVKGIGKLNGCPEDNVNKVKEVDSDGDGFPDIKDNCPNLYSSVHYGCPKSIAPKDADHDRIFDDVDRCPKVYAKTDDGCPEDNDDWIQQQESRYTEIVKQEKVEKEKQEKIQLEKENQILKNEVIELKKVSQDKLFELKKGTNTAEKSLKKLNSNDNQKETVDEAWNLLKYNQEMLEKIQDRIFQGDTKFENELYVNAKNLYSINANLSDKLGDNLEKISKIIEQIKPKSCFLWWC